MTALCSVMVELLSPNGSPMVGASVRATLLAPVVHNDVVLPMSVTSFTDYRGQCVLPLYPSDASTPPVPYRFELVPAGSMRPIYFENVVVPSLASVALKQLLGGSDDADNYIADDYVVAGYVN